MSSEAFRSLAAEDNTTHKDGYWWRTERWPYGLFFVIWQERRHEGGIFAYCWCSSFCWPQSYLCKCAKVLKRFRHDWKTGWLRNILRHLPSNGEHKTVGWLWRYGRGAEDTWQGANRYDIIGRTEACPD